MNEQILKFHYEELIYALMILNTDLSDYPENELKNFAEAILRLDDLSESEFLKSLESINPFINDVVISKISKLQALISKLYGQQWYKSLGTKNKVLKRSRAMAEGLLFDLKEEYVEPYQFAEKNMNL